MVKLDAVNMCLRGMSLDPVNALGSGDGTAARAVEVVNEITEDVQVSGWSCNTDFEVTLNLDVDGKIAVPANTLVVSAQNYNPALTRVSLRTGTDGIKRLWDVRNRTDVFSQPVKVDLISLLVFDDLTYALQRYIAARSARTFVAEKLGAEAVDKKLLRREQETYTALIDEEGTAEDWNILTDNEHCARITSRYNSFFGR